MEEQAIDEILAMMDQGGVPASEDLSEVPEEAMFPQGIPMEEEQQGMNPDEELARVFQSPIFIEAVKVAVMEALIEMSQGGQQQSTAPAEPVPVEGPTTPVV